MSFARSLRSAWLAAALLVLGACGRDALTVQMGGVALSVTGAASASAAIDTWRVTVSGQGTPQTRTGNPGGTIQFSELLPGAYTVLLEGLEGTDVASRGQTAVTVQSGRTATASISPAAVLPTLSISAGDAAASEVGPDSGSVTITRAGPASAAVVVNLTLTGTATAATDYRTIASTIAMGAGQRTVAISVLPVADVVQDADETVIVGVAPGTGYDVGSPSSATVTIADAPVPVVTVTAPDAAAAEPGGNTGTFRISRTGVTTAALAVSVTLSGTATGGTDYQTIATTQTIPSGAAFVDVVLTPLSDAVVEADETAVLTAVAGTGYAVGTPAAATVTIAQAPAAASNLVVTPSPATVRVGEQVTLVPTATPAGTGVTVTYSFSSSDQTRATVSATTGAVAGVAVGTPTITVTATASGGGFTPAVLTATVPVTVVNALGVGFGAEQFASIAAGSGLRGSTNGNADEQPVRTIFVSAFSIQRTEVTQGQWRQVMAGTALANPSGFGTCGDTCPVEQVTWDDVQQFLTRLNQQDPGKGYRLPTEAEWEWAARGGTTGDLNVAGRTVEELAWISTNSQGRTWPVAQKLPNAYGLYDTIGNVWEWVNDWYSATYYSNAPPVDPPGPATGTRRSLRGSSWFFNATFARVAIRENLATTDRTDALGFRLARNP